jgi:branched-chain amino acid transport system permease protein
MSWALRESAARLVPLILLVALVILVAGTATFAPIILQRRVTQALIMLVGVVGLYVFAGNSGVFSFGNVGFMAIAAYVSALLTMAPAQKSIFLPDLPRLLADQHWPAPLGALAGGASTAAIGAIVGFPLMRLSGISASIATFSILVVVYVGLGNWTSVTGGQNSLMGLPNYVGLWTAAIWAVVAIAIAFAYQESRGGLLLRASREDEVAARAAGVDIVRHRWIAFTLSAFLSGVSGVLLAHFLGTVRVETYYLDLTFLIIAMLVIGGAGSLTGAAAGALTISLLTEVLREAEVGFSVSGVHLAAPSGLGDSALALLMLIIILYRPKGIAGGREIGFPLRSASVAGCNGGAPRDPSSNPEREETHE